MEFGIAMLIILINTAWLRKLQEISYINHRNSFVTGIAMFKEDKTMSNTKKTFHVKCYNIPILMAYVEEHDARQDIRDRKDFEERFDIDSIGFEFMQKINFDLNKSLYDGVIIFIA